MLVKPNIIWIDGPVGQLQTIYIPAQNQEVGVAVINHPNPLQGGTFTNKVIQTVAKSLSNLGFHCYLPNFRGVGDSEGVHDYGVGEVEDCFAISEFAKRQHPMLKKFVLSGFSFGGFVALQSAKIIHPTTILLLAPAIGIYDKPTPDTILPMNTLLIHGELDEVVPLKNSLDWANNQQIPVVVISQAGHFFHGKLILLKDWVRQLLPNFYNK